MAASDSFLLLLCLALLMAMAAATKFRVGGSMGWTVPSGPNAMSYNQWAERNRFQIGDSLLFVFQPGSDSVLQVSQDAYSTCSTSSPIRSYSNGGSTEVTLDRSGPFYFISGIEKNCLRNESMVVVVLADRSNLAPSSGSPTMPPSPSSSSSPPPSPAVAPTSSSPPSPSTAGSPPSPHTSSPSEVTPSPAPTGGEGSPAKNGAPLKAMGFMGTVGALLGSILVL